MAGNKIADFFAEIGIKADVGTLAKIDKKLDDLERALHNLEKGANRSVKKITEPMNALSSAARSSAKSVNNLKKAEDDLSRSSAKSNKQLGERSKQLSKIEKIQSNIVKSPLSQSIADATAGLGKSRSEYEKFWKSAQVGKYLVANKANQISQGGRERVDDIRDKRIDHVALAREAMTDRVLNNSYDKSLPRDKQYHPRDSIKSNIDDLMNPMKELSRRAQKQAQHMYDELFKSADKNADLKNKIMERMKSQNPSVSGKFGNLVFTENRLARERIELAAQEAKLKSEAASKAIADEKARQKYLKQAQDQYLRDMEKASKEAERSERTKLRLLEQQERVAQRKAAAENREYERSRRRGEIATRQAYIDSRREELNKARMAAYDRMGRGKVGRPSEFSFGPMGAAGSIRGGIASFLPGFGLAYGLMNMNQINQQIQGQKSAMTSIMSQATPGSTPEQAASLGQGQIKWVEDMSNNLGTDSRSGITSYSKMLQSGIEGGLNIGNVQNVFKGVSEYGRVMGLDQESMKGSFVAIEQMMNKGQIYAEELKTQLAERMPGVMSAMAQAGGFGTDEKAVSKLLDAMKQGKVQTKDVIEKFSNILSERARAGGALEKAMKSSTAEQARYGNAITKWVEKFSDAGGEQGFARIFRGFREALEDNEESATKLGKAFEYLSFIIRGLVRGAGEVYKIFMQLAPALGISENALLAVVAAVSVLILPFGEVILVVGALLLVLEDLKSWADGNGSLFKRIFESLDPKTQENIKEIAKLVKELGNNLLEIGKLAFEGWGKLFDFWMEGGGSDGVISRMRDMLNILTGVTGAIVSIGKGNFSDALGQLGKAANGVYNVGGLGFASNLISGKSNQEVRQRNEDIANSNNQNTPIPFGIRRMQDNQMNPQDMITRMNDMANNYVQSQKSPEVHIGDTTITITLSGVDPSQMTEEVGKRLNAHLQQVFLDTAAGIGAQTQ